jgi:hypothetical protein
MVQMWPFRSSRVAIVLTVSWLLVITLIVACTPGARSPNATSRVADSALVVDSSRYTVSYAAPLYHAVIGYSYTNRTKRPVSLASCGHPTPPILEKELSAGNWVQAYDIFLLGCLTLPPLRIPPGVTYRDSLRVSVARRGAWVGWPLGVENMTGTYRLHWTLRAGTDPLNYAAAAVEAFSPRFELVER